MPPLFHFYEASWCLNMLEKRLWSYYGHFMQTTITNFKAKCIHFVDTVQHQGDVVIITRHGKAAAKLVPIDPETDQSPFGLGAGTVQELGELYSTGEKWDAESE